MNKVFRIVWSAARGAFIVTHENACGHGKPSSTQRTPDAADTAMSQGQHGLAWNAPTISLAAVAVALCLAVLPTRTLAAPPVNTLPTNGQIVGGAAAGNIANVGSAMTVTQNHQHMIANWQSFNIGSAASVHFAQPTGGVALNRVTGSAPSEIFGRLSATGSVFLLNPNGVMFGPGASVNVGALVATTMKMNDSDFMAGNYQFTGGNGSVINQGSLTAAQGGYIALLAPEVRNEGLISASMGSVLLAGAEAVTLSHDNTGLHYAVDKGAVQALVENKHLIQADGGQVILTARAANQLASAVINNSGTIEAKGLVAKGGKIVLEADHITLKAGSTLDASGDTGGGTVLVGGDWQGSGSMQQAVTVNMENGAKIDVSAKTTGDGGKAVLWSDVNKEGGFTRADGEILAKGGSESGDGGKVEISGNFLQLGENISVDTQAAKGNTGLLLLDPMDIIISNSKPASVYDISSLVWGDQWNNLASANWNTGGVTWTTPGNIVNILNNTNVSLYAYRDITIGDAINASGTGTNNGMTMQAGRSILINADITLRGYFSATANVFTNAASSNVRGTEAGNFTTAAGTTISTNGGGGSTTAKTIDIRVSPLGENAGSATIYNLIAGTTAGVSKDISILADTINLAGGADSIQTSGAVTLGPSTASRNIIVGAAGSGNELVIDATALAALKTGYSALNIGDNTGGTRDTIDVTLSGTTTVAGSMTFTAPVNFFGGTFTQNAGSTITAPGVGIYADTMNLNGGTNSITSTGYAAFGPGTFTKTSVIGATGTAGQWWFDAAKLSTVQSVFTAGHTGLTLGAPALESLTTSGSTSLAGSLGSTGPVTIVGRNVTVDGAYSWSDASTLTLKADRSITINAAITASNASGKLALSYGQGSTAAQVASNPGYYSSFGSSGKVNLQAGQNYDTKAGYDGTLKNWQVITSLGVETDATSGALTLQGMAASANLATSFVLGGDIDASLSNMNMWNSEKGWKPIGATGVGNAFSGDFSGLGHTITGLYINRPSESLVGLFGYVTGSSISNVGLVNASVTGGNQSGSIAGLMESARTTIDRVYATGSVTGSGSSIGGLIGSVASTGGASIMNSYTDMAVTSGDTGDIGGLIGSSQHSLGIADSYARGNVVTVANRTGGLVGSSNQSATISRSYMLGNVGKFSDANGTPDAAANGARVGGLIGHAGSSLAITESYNKGHVAGWYDVGGLVGYSQGSTSITRSYTTGNVKTRADGQRAGGLIGWSGGYTVLTDNYTTGTIHAQQQDAGGLVGQMGADLYLYGGNYVAGSVLPTSQIYNGQYRAGAFVGWRTGNLGITTATAVNSLPGGEGGWDWSVWELRTGVGKTTRPDANGLKIQSNYLQGANQFDFTTTWAIDPSINNGMPYLRANVPLTFVTITLPSYTMTYGDTVPTITSAWSATGGTSYISALNWGSSIGSKPNAGTYTYGTDSNLFSISYASGSAASYSITYSNNSLTVDKRPINITADSGQTKTYGAANPTYTYAAEAAGSSRGLVSGDTFTGALARVAGENVGAYAINNVGTLANSNYAITVVPKDFSITPAQLTVTASAQSKTYGDLLSLGTSAFTTLGLQNSETVGAVTLAATGGTAATDNAGNYTITPSAATGGSFTASNYNITYNTAALTVDKALITLTANNQSKTYGSTLALGTTAYTVSSGTTKNSDTINGVTLASAGAVDTAPATTYTITPSAATGTGGFNTTNYTISYGNGTLTVDKAALTVAAANYSKTYDAVAYSGGNGVSYSGFVLTQNESVLGGALSYAGTAQGAVDYSADNYTIVPQGYTSANYAFTYVPGTLTINKKTVALSAAKTYDGNTTLGTGTVSIATGIAGQALTYSSATSLSKNVADNATNYITALTLGNGTGGTASNYQLPTLNAANAPVTLAKQDVSVTSISIADKVYDGTTNASSVQSTVLSGVVGADTANVSTSGTLAAFGGKDVGTYSISVTGLALTGSEAGNYNLTGGTTATDTSVAINRKTVTLSASKAYDGTTDLTGFVTIDTGVTVAGTTETLTYTSATANDKHVATVGKFVNAITLANATDSSGGVATNYQLPTLDLANAPVTITTRPIDITAVATSKTYGEADPALTYTAEASGGNRGLVSSDTFTGSLTRVSGETVSGGPYAISQGTTLANSDYAITFFGNNLTINQRPITLTATAASKIYGEVDPALAVTTSASGAGVGLATSANGNTVDDTLGDVSGTLSRETGSIVGAYDIALGAGAKASNYAITFVTDNNAITINRRPVNVTADAKFKTYGDADPALTFVAETQSSGRGVLSSETLSGALSRVAGKTSGPGGVTYQIQQGTVTNTINGNYAISYTGANLSITQKNLTLAGNTGVTKTYDGTTAMPVGNLGYGSLVGIVGSDTVTVSGAPVYDSANANAVRTVLIGNVGIAGADASNYTMSWSIGSGTINQAPLFVTANGDAKFVTQADLSGYNGVSYSGFVNGETTSALNISGLAIARNNSGQNNAGTYAGVLVASGVTAANYAVSYVNGVYTVVPANQLLVRVQNTSTTYGTGPSYTITDARYMDGSNVIHTLAAPTISGNTATYSDGVGGSASFTLGPVAAQNSTANLLNAGGYAIGASNVTESSANFSDTLTVIGALTVDKKALSANASNVSKVYDGTTAMTNVVLGYTGLEANDVVTISGNGNFSGKNVGTAKTYTVSSLTLGSTDAANYFLSGGTSLSGSNGEVTRKTVSLAAARTYDGSTTLGAGTVTITTGVTGETLTYSNATATSKNVGANYINAITLGDEVGATSTSGGLASNYQLPGMSTDSADNTVSFAQKTLTISGILAANKTYDGGTVAAISVAGVSATALQTGGMVAGDDITVAASGNFRNADNTANDKNVGTTKTVLLASTYGGVDVSNYAITDQETTTAAVTPKALTMTGHSVENKTFDGLTAAVTKLGALTGLVAAETLAVSGTSNFADPNVGVDKTVTIQLALANGTNGGLASNYTISNATTTANINPQPTTVPPPPPSIPTAPTPPGEVPTPPPPPEPPSGPTGTPAPGGDPSGTPAPSGDPTGTPAPSGGSTGTPTPGGDPSGTTAQGSDPTGTPAPTGDPIPITLAAGGEIMLSGEPGSQGGASSSGTSIGGGEGNGFISVRSFGATTVPVDALFSFTLPRDTFKHADPKATVVLEARLADGQPLPDWLQFDAGSGRFTGRAPQGVQEIEIRVTARDSTGGEAGTNVMLRFNSAS